MSVTVRPDPELPAVLDLLARAFPGEDLRPLVLALATRADEVVSLGAVLDGALVGHVMLTRCATPGDPAGALLAPLSVDAEVRGCGIGPPLVDTGLARLAEAAVRQVFVLGDPRFCGRLGFAAESQVLPPCPLPVAWRDAWQSRIIAGQPLAPGHLTLAAPWHDPALWNDAG